MHLLSRRNVVKAFRTAQEYIISGSLFSFESEIDSSIIHYYSKAQLD